jgi:glutamate-1-semialdehyde 2,1-aminomutase
MLNDIESVFQNGTSYGVPSHLEVTMAEMIAEAYPAAELVRMVNSGTEATMSAIRVARGYTNRQKILKFEGCYHGHSDALLVKSGSGTLTYGVPTSPGVPADTVKDTLVGIYNDVAGLEALFADQGSEIACVIVEVVAGNMGVVPATDAFMAALRRLTTAYGTVLIFDEVITGFRLAYGGASEIYGIDPDMVCFGKIIGGGLPVGAYAGKRDIMSMVSPMGPVYQAGTLSGNPLAMHMGIQTLKYLKTHPELYLQLEEKASYLTSEMTAFIESNDLPVTFVRFHSMPCLFFAKGPFKSYDDVKSCDTEAYATYFRKMLDKGVLLPPAQFEGLFLSVSHDDVILEAYLNASKSTLLEMYK